MSIIYDALQKTQRSLRHKHAITRRSHLDWIDILLVSIIILLLMGIVTAYYPYFIKHSPSIMQKTEQYLFSKNSSVKKSIMLPGSVSAKIETEFKSKFFLKGVFLSEMETSALINNQSYHLGDDVGGMKIVSIDIDSVKLQNENGTLLLRASA